MKLVEQTIDHWIKVAQERATNAHAGQTRNDRSSYINHPAAVAAMVEDRLKPIAWLHDVVEDTKVTLEDLKQEGFPDYIVNAVDLLTHKNREPNISYWTRITSNPDAAKVKVKDISHNLSDSPNERQAQKYAIALQLFKKAGYLP